MQTLQSLFDESVNHLRKQNAKSIDAYESSCLYRSGCLKCAAGIFITDEEYQLWMDQAEKVGDLGKNFFQVLTDERCPLSLKERFKDQSHIDLAIELQNIHDAIPIKQWEENFERLANEQGLVYTPKS